MISRDTFAVKQCLEQAATFRSIKSVDANLRVGGPSTARGEWIGEFVQYGRANGCEPDFLITHIYNNDSASAPLSPFDGPQKDRENTSPHFAAGTVRGVRREVEAMGYRGEIHWNEWGRSWWPCFPSRESAAEAAFVVKTMAEVSQYADYFAYWCLSDIYDQCGYGAETFHGNYGLLSLQGLRKPAYQAFRLLGRLGTSRVAVPEAANTRSGAITTTSPDGQQIIVYSYADESPRRQRVAVTLPPNAASREITLHRIGSAENNILHAWREMGSPDYLRPPQRRDLEAANALRAAGRGDIRTMDGVAVFEMESPGVALLEIR